MVRKLLLVLVGAALGVGAVVGLPKPEEPDCGCKVTCKCKPKCLCAVK